MSGPVAAVSGAVCGRAVGVSRVPDAAAVVAARLAVVAPELVDGFWAAVPRAGEVVGRRLVDALCRERVGEARRRFGGSGRWHGFDRFVVDRLAVAEPVDLLPAEVRDRRGWALTAELTNAVVNLAVAVARSPEGGGLPRWLGSADEWAVRAEGLAVAGHNLHPCGRTRLGWDVDDVLAHDVESGATRVGFVAVRRDLHVGDDVVGALSAAYPGIPVAPSGFVAQPVHAWQWEAVVRRRYPELVRSGMLRPLAGELVVVPTAAVRTVLLPVGRDGGRHYLKLSVDIQVTSTRRTISVASTRNGPVLSAVLSRLVADDEAGGRLVLLPETAGAAVGVGSGRDVSAIVREGLAGRLEPGEVAVPGVALAVGAVLAARVDEYGRVRGCVDRAAAALGFVAEYARVLLAPLLRLATRFGVGLEAHLQNCLPTFRGGVPYRMVVRDFAGLRVHRPRLAGAGVSVALAPGSVVGTDDVQVMWAKVGYTALQAHLGELVLGLTGSHGLDESAAWRAVRAVVDEVCEGLRADPVVAARAVADHAALTAGLVPHKALVRMRLAGAGDVYVPVRNPLADGGFSGAAPEDVR